MAKDPGFDLSAGPPRSRVAETEEGLRHARRRRGRRGVGPWQAKRNVLSDYTFAIRDEATDRLLPVGKAYSGLTDVEIAQYTDYFFQHTLEEKGRYRLVQPEVVLEVAFDTIQRSESATPRATRCAFPRILRIRDDKPVSEIDTLAYCRELAETAARGWTAPAASSEIPMTP